MLGEAEFAEIYEAQAKAEAADAEERGEDVCMDCRAKGRELRLMMGFLLCWACRLRLSTPFWFHPAIDWLERKGVTK